MSDDLSKAGVQLCMAAKNVRKSPFTGDDLRAFGELAFKEDLEDWSKEFEQLMALNFFQKENDGYVLTSDGQDYIEKVIANGFFGKMLLRAEQSQAFASYCERVYGKNLSQF